MTRVIEQTNVRRTPAAAIRSSPDGLDLPGPRPAAQLRPTPPVPVSSDQLSCEVLYNSTYVAE